MRPAPAPTYYKEEDTKTRGWGARRVLENEALFRFLKKHIGFQLKWKSQDIKLDNVKLEVIQLTSKYNCLIQCAVKKKCYIF